VNPTPDERRRHPAEAGAEWTVLDLLLEYPRPWRVEELIDAIDSPVAVAEAVDTLHATGIIERTGAFVRIAPKDR
jgi:predicted transcriptional regulator